MQEEREEKDVGAARRFHASAQDKEETRARLTHYNAGHRVSFVEQNVCLSKPGAKLFLLLSFPRSKLMIARTANMATTVTRDGEQGKKAGKRRAR